MFNGDFWIYPDGSCQNMGQGEHAEVALAYMLKLPPELSRIPRNKLFNGLKAFTPEQLEYAKAMGVEQRVFDFLSQPSPDPRYFVMKEYGWIRVSKAKMNVWSWPQSLEILRRCSYWSQQPNLVPQDMFDVIEFSTNREFSITVEKILGGEDIGESAVEAEPEKLYTGPRKGAHSDAPGKESWVYRRIGDNRRK